jgi:hypothetical protein
MARRQGAKPGPKPRTDGRIFKGIGVRVRPEAVETLHELAEQRNTSFAVFVGRLIEDAAGVRVGAQDNSQDKE